MKPLLLLVVAGLLCATQGVAEPVSYKEARKILPKAKGRVNVTTFEDRVPQEDLAKLETAGLSLKKVFELTAASLSGYGAAALSPDEGLLAESAGYGAVSAHHSLAAARDAAVAACNARRKDTSSECVTFLELSPKGSATDDALSLSEAANAALRSDYRKLKAPKAFAISPSLGGYAHDRGDGSRALDACARATGASDCVIVVQD